MPRTTKVCWVLYSVSLESSGIQSVSFPCPREFILDTRLLKFLALYRVHRASHSMEQRSSWRFGWRSLPFTQNWSSLLCSRKPATWCWPDWLFIPHSHIPFVKICFNDNCRSVAGDSMWSPAFRCSLEYLARFLLFCFIMPFMMALVKSVVRQVAASYTASSLVGALKYAGCLQRNALISS